MAWVFAADTPEPDGFAVLEFVRDRVCLDPDFGEVIAERTRGAVAPGSIVEVIWTFDPEKRHVEIVAPGADLTQ